MPGTAHRNLLRGFDDALDAGMAVQRNTHRHALAEQRPHPAEMPAQE
jgi:hypothetical protein